MSRPVLVIYVTNARANWWCEHLQQLLPELDCKLWNELQTNDNVEYAVVWRPPQGWLADFKNLKCIVSIGAGIDHILRDDKLPDRVPIIRTTGEDLTQRMCEYVCLHVLAEHRQFHALQRSQRNREWQPLLTPTARETTVGIMGLGKLGKSAATSLNSLGYRVTGWAQRQHAIDNVQCYNGVQLHRFLEHANILVCLLPLTDKTTNILNKSLFDKLPEGACLINAARGEHLVESDLLDALHTKQISHATLDVFRDEPLPADHPFWTHPNISITPHVASLIDPVSGGKEIARNLRTFRAGKFVEDLTDRGRGY